MRWRRNKGRGTVLRITMPLVVLALLLLRPTSTYAHPLGNFTVNRYSRLELGATEIRIRYAVSYTHLTLPTIYSV